MASRPTREAANPETSSSSGCHSRAPKSACATGDGMGSSRGISRTPGCAAIQLAEPGFDEPDSEAGAVAGLLSEALPSAGLPSEAEAFAPSPVLDSGTDSEALELLLCA